MRRRYDRPIIIQRKTVTQSDSGAEVETWADLAYRCFAFFQPVRGTEQSASGNQDVARQMVTFVTRFHNIPSASRPLGPEDRIIYPADGIAANTQAPATNKIHDVISADEVGRDVDLSIKTLRRSDVTS
jgi:head-tail adaptor